MCLPGLAKIRETILEISCQKGFFRPILALCNLTTVFVEEHCILFYKKLRCHNGVLITAIAKKDLYFYQIRYRTFNLGDGLYHCAGSVHKWNVSIVNNE